MLWSEFQDTAERLVRGATEGDWRSAVSRSYYAAFHYFRELFLAHSVDVGRGGQSHFNLAKGLVNCGLPLATPFGRRLDDLRIERATADYDLVKRTNQAFARAAVQRGRTLTGDFQNLTVTLPAPQIVAGARRYLKSIGHIP